MHKKQKINTFNIFIYNIRLFPLSDQFYNQRQYDNNSR